jgi:hypothetical protein
MIKDIYILVYLYLYKCIFAHLCLYVHIQDAVILTFLEKGEYQLLHGSKVNSKKQFIKGGSPL